MGCGFACMCVSAGFADGFLGWKIVFAADDKRESESERVRGKAKESACVVMVR